MAVANKVVVRPNGVDGVVAANKLQASIVKTLKDVRDVSPALPARRPVVQMKAKARPPAPGETGEVDHFFLG